MTSSAFHLCGGKGKRVGIATRGRTMNEPRMGEEIGRAPQQFDAGALLFPFQDFDDGVEIFVGLAQRFAFRRDVAVMKGIERRAEFFNELERDPRAILGIGHRIGAIVPWPDRRAHPERIGERVAERVPIDDRKAQMFAQGFALDDFSRVVMFEGQRVFGFRPFVFDF